MKAFCCSCVVQRFVLQRRSFKAKVPFKRWIKQTFYKDMKNPYFIAIYLTCAVAFCSEEDFGVPRKASKTVICDKTLQKSFIDKQTSSQGLSSWNLPDDTPKLSDGSCQFIMQDERFSVDSKSNNPDNHIQTGPRSTDSSVSILDLKSDNRDHRPRLVHEKTMHGKSVYDSNGLLCEVRDPPDRKKMKRWEEEESKRWEEESDCEYETRREVLTANSESVISHPTLCKNRTVTPVFSPEGVFQKCSFASKPPSRSRIKVLFCCCFSKKNNNKKFRCIEETSSRRVRQIDEFQFGF